MLRHTDNVGCPPKCNIMRDMGRPCFKNRTMPVWQVSSGCAFLKYSVPIFRGGMIAQSLPRKIDSSSLVVRRPAFNFSSFSFGLILLACISLAGCSASPLLLNLDTSMPHHIEPQTQALPLTLRIYQLSSIARFQQASFLDLWRDDELALGPSELSRHDVTLVPGKDVEIELTRAAGVKYLGVMAQFMDPQGNYWRQIMPLGSAWENCLHPLRLRVQADKLTVMA